MTRTTRVVNSMLVVFFVAVLLPPPGAAFVPHGAVMSFRGRITIGGGDGITTTTTRGRFLARDEGVRSGRSSLFAASGADDDDDEELFQTQDPASSTPQLLAALWSMIAKGVRTMTRGQEMTVLFPHMKSSLSSSSYVERLMNHFELCKDVCDDFGINTVLIPKITPERIVVGFTVKSYKSADNDVDDDDATGGYKFTNDDFWDDDLEITIDQSLLEDDDDDNDDWNAGLTASAGAEDTTPDDDESLISITKSWVKSLMSDMGVCPFTSGSEMAGLPMGQVYYTVSRVATAEDMYAAYWTEVVRVETCDEKSLSTTLLVTPNFAQHNIEMFENFSNTLTQPLEGLAVDELIQLVFFHPVWTFRDGAARGQDQNAANYARRSPWPMINILRTKQVRTAQRGIPTGLVYQQNERTLTKVGSGALEGMLQKRDWTELEGHKVDRKDIEALRIAKDLQEAGAVKVEDMTLREDSTPAANKVDLKQIEGGDMVTVIRQALEKRLEKREFLTGPETSAALMATDFLLQELDNMGKSKAGTSQPVTKDETAIMGEDSGFLQDMDDDGLGNPFGEGYSEGLNPANLY